MNNKTVLDDLLEYGGRNCNPVVAFLDGLLKTPKAVYDGVSNWDREKFKISLHNSDKRDVHYRLNSDLADFSFYVGDIIGSFGVPLYVAQEIVEKLL